MSKRKDQLTETYLAWDEVCWVSIVIFVLELLPRSQQGPKHGLESLPEICPDLLVLQSEVDFLVLSQFTDQGAGYPGLDLLVAHEDDTRAEGEQDDDVHAAQGDHVHEHL